MPNFANVETVYAQPKKMNVPEVVRAIKFAIAGEFEAVQIYEQIMESTENEKIRMVLSEITEDERRHSGSLYKLLTLISPVDAAAMEYGAKEALESLGTK